MGSLPLRGGRERSLPPPLKCDSDLRPKKRCITTFSRCTHFMSLSQRWGVLESPHLRKRDRSSLSASSPILAMEESQA